ncbi:MAG: DNA-processing protein DprA [Cyclobacteriaceae bacterium]|nr:DNA-processing protein DprA [Cyclobacteriaceae bacterium]
MDNSILALLALHLTPGIGGHTIRQLISHVGSPENVFKIPKGKLASIPGIGKARIEWLSQKEGFAKSEKILTEAQNSKTKVLAFYEKDFPQRLKNCYDAPVLLFYKGNANLNSDKIISLVGTRKATTYGIEQAQTIIKGIKNYQPLIISGLAYGIDISAHLAAMESGLPTVAVMASGINHIYPSKHKPIASKMTDQGGLLTEYAFEELPEPGKFPARNRIIAGLSDAVIVVEAAAKGGALITAEMANSYNREVFAVPGNNQRTTSEGCNLLIRNHKANILTKPEDIPYILGWELTAKPFPVQSIPELEQDEKTVWKVLSSGTEFMIDELSIRSGIPMNKLAGVLLSLEFKGHVKALPGKRFKLAA